MYLHCAQTKDFMSVTPGTPTTVISWNLLHPLIFISLVMVIGYQASCKGVDDRKIKYESNIEWLGAFHETQNK